MPDRDLVGYGPHSPHPQWPGRARLGLQFVLNIEEGAEATPINGDATSEGYLHELPGRPIRQGERDLSVESLYEYGARSGVWRILGLFRERGLPLTAFLVGRALELNPAIGQTLLADGHELAGHGYRWLDYRLIPPEVERELIQRTIQIIEAVSGQRPLGWYTGRVSPHTRRLLREIGGWLYDSDAYNDDLHYWLPDGPPHLVVPYTLVNNDCRYLLPTGFGAEGGLFSALRDAFDCLWREGSVGPKLMIVGLHGRISGHPARAQALARFLDHVAGFPEVWICRRDAVARHWFQHFPWPG